MRKKTISLIASLVLLSSSSIFAQAKKDEKPAAAPASPPVEESKAWYDKINLSGFVDVYYQYVNNNKQGSDVDVSRTFETYNKQFAVNSVELDVEKVAEKSSPWGFRIDFMNGQNAMFQERPFYTTNGIYNMNLLQQAYVSFFFPVLKGLTVDVGKMATHIGYEVLESKDNMNYTIGYIFFNTVPFIHTGARASLAINDRLNAGFYLYNSAQGTGFTANGDQFGYSGITPYGDPATGSSLTNTAVHPYSDGRREQKAVGTQLKATVIEDKFNIVWNTLYGNDNTVGRPTNGQLYSCNLAGVTTCSVPSDGKIDYWFVNNLILSATPTDKLTINFDWTYGERGGQSNTAAFGWDLTGTDVSGYPYGRPDKIKQVYNTFGLWIKYAFTETFALAFRAERIDDSKYGGPLVVNAPNTFVSPYVNYGASDWKAPIVQDILTNGFNPASAEHVAAVASLTRADLLYADISGQRASAAGYGMLRTYTITPTYTWSENVIVKLDLRRDEGPGKQFIDRNGNPTEGQFGATLGIVAKFD
ncbi:outer membrane protein [Leptospira sp. B5-022]|nr:outer membrane protein [Leptospira sp. B5-022]MCR1792586.1 porin [Leptospira sp. id769339]